MHWATDYLPWLGKLENKEAVGAAKEVAMKDTTKFLKTCWKEAKMNAVWPELNKFAKLVEKLQFEDVPDYGKCVDMFSGKVIDEEEEDEEEEEPTVEKVPVKRGARKAKKIVQVSSESCLLYTSPSPRD